MLMFNLESLQTHIPPVREFKRAPTGHWHPSLCGDIDIRITPQGQWCHEGSVIRREALVRLLASVLVLEEGEYWLKTPAEKLRIQVEDAPFSVQDLQVADMDAAGALKIRTNVGEDRVLTEPWTLTQTPGGDWLPLLPIAQGLTARLTRNLYYHLCHLALAQDSPSELADGVLYWSAAGQRWPLGKL